MIEELPRNIKTEVEMIHEIRVPLTMVEISRDKAIDVEIFKRIPIKFVVIFP